MEKIPLGGSCGCFWSPQTSQGAVSAPPFCLESLLVPFSLFQSMEAQAAFPSSSGAGQVEKCRMGLSPSLSLPKAAQSHLPPALGCSPQHLLLLLLTTSHGTKAGPSWGPGDPSGLVWTQAGARLSLP